MPRSPGPGPRHDAAASAPPEQAAQDGKGRAGPLSSPLPSDGDKAATARRDGFVAFCARAIQQFLGRNSMQMAAAIAFYSFFSLFPLSLLIILALGKFTDMTSVQNDVLVWVVGPFIPVSQREIIGTIQGVALDWDWRASGPLAFGGLVSASTAMFATLRKGINATCAIYTPRPFLRERIMDLTVTASAGVLFVFLLYSTTVLHSLSEGDPDLLGGPARQFFVGLMPTFLAFAFMCWFLPNRSMRFRDILFGALIVAIAFEVAKTIFFYYTARRHGIDQVYGSPTSVSVLLGWLYLSAAIVLIGSLISTVYLGLVQAGIASPATFGTWARFRWRGASESV